MTPPTRRDALRIGAASVGAALAGCLTDQNFTPGDDEVTVPDGGAILRMEQVPLTSAKSSASVAVFSERFRLLFRQAVARGTVVVPDVNGLNAGLEQPDYVENGGTYYDVSTSFEEGEETYEIALEPVAEVESGASVVDFDDLAPEQQKVVRDARQDDAEFDADNDYGGAYDFAAEYDYLEHEGNYYELTLVQTEGPASGTTISIEEVDSETVGPDASVYKLVFVDLDEDEQEAVETAMDTGRYVSEEALTDDLVAAVAENDYATRRSALFDGAVETDTE